MFEWKRPWGFGTTLIVFGSLFMFVAFMATNAPLNSGEERSLGEKIGVFAFLGSFGLVMIYLGLVLAVNRTRILARKHTVLQTTGPLPWSRRVELPSAGLKQFFAVSNTYNRSNGTYSAGTVYAIDSNDHVWILASQLPSSFAANQICHELEDFYGIEDVPVYGVTTDPAHPGPRT